MKSIKITETESKMERIKNKFADVFEKFDQKNFDLPGGDGLLKGKVLRISKTWPIRASVGSAGSDSFDDWVYILKSDYPRVYLHLFELIFNSLLAKFCLERKHQLGEEDHLTIDQQYINNFPVFDLEYDYGVPDEILETEKLLQSQPSDCPEYVRLQEKLENPSFSINKRNFLRTLLILLREEYRSHFVEGILFLRYQFSGQANLLKLFIRIS